MIMARPNQHTSSGPYRPTSETPFKWRFACGPIVARFYIYILTGSVPVVFVHLDHCDCTDTFRMLFVVCCFFFLFRINCFEKYFQEYDQSAKQVGSGSGPTFLKVISRQRGKAPFCTVSSKLKLTKQLNFLILFHVCRLSA